MAHVTSVEISICFLILKPLLYFYYYYYYFFFFILSSKHERRRDSHKQMRRKRTKLIQRSGFLVSIDILQQGFVYYL